MKQAMTEKVLVKENIKYRGSGGVSAENHSSGFRPAFLDIDSGVIYVSRFADGRPAPLHLLDGLPDELVLARDAAGKVARVKGSVTSGFVRGGTFYSREDAGRQANRESCGGVAA